MIGTYLIFLGKVVTKYGINMTQSGPATGKKKKQLNELINNTIFYLLDSLLCSSSSCIHSSCICYNTNGAFFSECYNQIPSLPLRKPEKKGELMRSMDVDYSDFRSP